MIPYGRQHVTQEDIAAVTEVLQSDWLTQGPAVPRFEQGIAGYCGAQHAVAVNNATSALHVACAALELGPSDWLWTSPNTFVASANCGLYCGAQVDFVDIDPYTYNMSVKALTSKLERAALDGCLPKVVIPVHFAGQSCDMRAIHALGQRYDFRIIEDASHAIGGNYLGQPVGNCRFSDIAVFSFHPVKIITTGEGGMAVTNSAALAERMQRLRSHGITRDVGHMQGASHGPWYYQQIELGYNYRLTDLQAALGYSQLGRLDMYIERRHELARRYDSLLKNLPIITPWQSPDAHSALHLYPIRVDASRTSRHRHEVYAELWAAGVGVNVHYVPVHLQPYYQQFGFQSGDFPQAERYYEEALSLPLYYGLTDVQQDKVAAVLAKTLS